MATPTRPWAFRREQLRDAMLDLAPVHHEALALAFFGGLTHVEVAERLGIPPVTARNRIRTALLRLRDVLSDPAREPTGAAVVAPRQRRLAEGRSGPPDWG